MKESYVFAFFGFAGAWIFFKKKFNRTGGIPYDSKDLDAVTRLILAETSFNRPHQETAMIIQVCVNRAKKSGLSLAQVCTPPGRPNWNNSKKFRQRWNESSGWPQFSRTQAFTAKVLDGGFENKIGGRVQFLHPRGMPKCVDGKCPPGRVCSNTVAGKRCLPRWSTVSVKSIDGARFS